MLMKDGSASGAESLAFSGRVRSHFSGFLPLEEPATLCKLYFFVVASNEYKHA